MSASLEEANHDLVTTPTGNMGHHVGRHLLEAGGSLPRFADVHGERAAIGWRDQARPDVWPGRYGQEGATHRDARSGAAAARLLRDRSWSGQEDVPVLGPEDLSYNDLAAIISEVFGCEVCYTQVPFEASKAQLLAHGMSEAFTQGWLGARPPSSGRLHSATGRRTS